MLLSAFVFSSVGEDLVNHACASIGLSSMRFFPFPLARAWSSALALDAGSITEFSARGCVDVKTTVRGLIPMFRYGTEHFLAPSRNEKSPAGN